MELWTKSRPKEQGNKGEVIGPLVAERMPPGGEEYKSFHYLMHAQEVKGGRVDYVDAPKPLTFDELYTPREGVVLMGTVSKSFWRTREAFDFHVYELRKERLIVVCCLEMNSKSVFKTIVAKMMPLYKQVEDKKRGAEEPIVRKNQKGLADDAALFPEVIKFLEARLNIGKDPVLWPKFIPPDETEKAPPAEADATADAGAVATVKEAAPTHATAAAAAGTDGSPEPELEGYKERMVLLTKISSDTEGYEVPVETLKFLKVDLSGIPAEQLKLEKGEMVKEDGKEKDAAPPSTEGTAPTDASLAPAPAPAPAPTPAPTPATATATATAGTEVAAAKKSTAATPTNAKAKPSAKQGSGYKKTAKVAPA